MRQKFYDVMVTKPNGDDEYRQWPLDFEEAKKAVDDLLTCVFLYREGYMIRVFRDAHLVAVWKFDERHGVFVREPEEKVRPFKKWRKLGGSFPNT